MRLPLWGLELPAQGVHGGVVPGLDQGRQAGQSQAAGVLQVAGGVLQDEAAHGAAREPGHQQQGEHQDQEQGRQQFTQQGCAMHGIPCLSERALYSPIL